MERLTKRIGKDAVHFDCHGTCGTCDGCTCFEIGGMVERLAVYEDTDLEPEEIKQMCALARLNSNIFDNDFGNHIAELIVAEQDGRLLVLPCKIGSTVYMATQVFDGSKTKWVIGSRKIDMIGGNALNSVWAVSTQPYELHFVPSEFGRSVFLTREDAEKALEEHK
jgi:hypothetical protein